MSLLHLQNRGLPPSRIALGCEPLGGTDWGEVDVNETRRAVQCALDLGITTFDTADVYGLGKSEEELSKALGNRRHDAFIITKFGVRWEKDATGGRAKTYFDSSPDYLRIALEESLRRLRIEAIPLYLVHWPDMNTPLEDTLGVLELLQEQGKILNYGLSNFDAESVKAAKEHFAISAVEGPYSLVDRSKEEMHTLATNLGMACFAYGPLAQGLLTGKYTPKSKFAANDRRKRLPQFEEEQWERNKNIILALSEVASRHNVSPAQVAIRWVLDGGCIDTAIVGAKSPGQVVGNFKALDMRLQPQDFERLKQAWIR